MAVQSATVKRFAKLTAIRVPTMYLCALVPRNSCLNVVTDIRVVCMIKLAGKINRSIVCELFDQVFGAYFKVNS